MEQNGKTIEPQAQYIAIDNIKYKLLDGYTRTSWKNHVRFRYERGPNPGYKPTGPRDC